MSISLYIINVQSVAATATDAVLNRSVIFCIVQPLFLIIVSKLDSYDDGMMNS